MTQDEFENIVSQSIGELPRDIRDKMDNVAIVVEDSPSQDQLKRGGTRHGDLLLGLYEGVPRTRRGPGYTLVLPDKITIFQRSIEAIASSPEEITHQVRETVRHEIAHHFGFDEPGARKVARPRKS